MKKLLCVIFTFIILTGAASAAYATTDTNAGTAGKSYTDVKSTNWAYASVNAMSEKGILKGYSDGTFKPSNTVTYGEFIKMALVAATNEDIDNSTTGNWALSYYNKALKLGYFGSTDIKAEQLNEIIARSDMALIISNILGETTIDDYDALDASISDVDSTTKNDYDIIKSYATGILTGYSDGTFKPLGTLTRAEAVTVIYRLVDESKRVLPGTTTTTSTTEKTLAEMITNYQSFYTENDVLDKYLAKTTSYTIEEDGAQYGMELNENRGTKWVSFPADVHKQLGRRYLIKDNKVVESLALGYGANMIGVGIYTYDITTVEYIGSLDDDYNMLLIVNPFKK